MLAKFLKILIIILFACSCNNELDFNVPIAEDKLVVDGIIEQDDYSYVILTNVSPFFAEYNSLELRKLVVMSAKVTVSDGVNSEILVLDKNSEFFPPYVYRGRTVKGEIGKNYTLTIDWNGNTYTANSKMIRPVKPEKYEYQVSIRENDTVSIIKALINDPVGEKNYYRAFTKVIGKQEGFYASLSSVVGDKLFNGQKYIHTIYRGYESLNFKDKIIYFSNYDSVAIKFCSIDQNCFDFWVSAEREMALAGNPIALSSKKVETNISNGALGHWSAYAFTIDTLFIDPVKYLEDTKIK